MWKVKNDKNYEWMKWPGVKAKLTKETDNIYEYTVPEAYEGENIIFNNGTSLIQTIDLKMAQNGFIFRNTDPSSRDIYFQTNWEGQINIHMWKDTTGDSTTWPGVPLEFLKEVESNKYYKYTIPEDYDKFLFVQKTDTGTGWRVTNKRYIIYRWK